MIAAFSRHSLLSADKNMCMVWSEQLSSTRMLFITQLPRSQADRGCLPCTETEQTHAVIGVCRHKGIGVLVLPLILSADNRYQRTQLLLAHISCRVHLYRKCLPAICTALLARISKNHLASRKNSFRGCIRIHRLRDQHPWPCIWNGAERCSPRRWKRGLFKPHACRPDEAVSLCTCL